MNKPIAAKTDGAAVVVRPFSSDVDRAEGRDVALMVFPGFQIQDLSGPLAVFEIGGKLTTRRFYRTHVVSEEGGLVTSSSGLAVATEAIGRHRFDTLLVVGGDLTDDPLEFARRWSDTVQAAAANVRRIASVCTGAFVLAAAGLLDGRRATTHWRHTADLQRLFPRVKVKGDSIFTADGGVWTSAGIAAGIDLALALVEDDLGGEMSRHVARLMVVYHRRAGGQSQFSALLDMQPESDRIRNVLTYIRDHLTDNLAVEALASVACLSPRQFGRAFQAETGETPAKAVERLRSEAARPRVERTAEPIEIIAREVGFIDPERMRRAFIRLFGHPPQAVRRLAVAERSMPVPHVAA